MLEEFYELYKNKIFLYHLRLTGSTHIAEELTQETFFQACRTLLSFRQDSTELTWLFSIARNVFIRYLRNKRKQDNLQNKINVNYTQQNIHNDSLVEVADILGKLPEQSATILILRGVERLSHWDIAKMLGITEENARVLCYRARKKFLKNLGGGEGNG